MVAERHKQVDGHRTFGIGATTPLLRDVLAVGFVDGGATKMHKCPRMKVRHTHI